MLFQRNAWYVAALPGDVDRTLRRRLILNDPVLLYRDEAGQIVALGDRCPHRFAPLSRGKLFGDVVQCAYHGLRFDRSGQCVLNPHGGVVAPHNRVRSYPVAEQHGFVWIWMGAPACADESAIPDLTYMTATGVRTVNNYMKGDYRYDILVDNLLDLSHADYLHAGSFTSGACASSETSVREEGDEVIIDFVQKDAPPPPGLDAMGTKVRRTFRIRWHPGQVITFELSVVPESEDCSSNFRTRFAHICTPETAGSTHYFLSTTREQALDNPAIDAEVGERQMSVIRSEDGPMLCAVDREMGGMELLDMRPVILSTDKGALRVRRTMKRLMEAEARVSAEAGMGRDPAAPEKPRRKEAAVEATAHGAPEFVERGRSGEPGL